MNGAVRVGYPSDRGLVNEVVFCTRGETGLSKKSCPKPDDLLSGPSLYFWIPSSSIATNHRSQYGRGASSALVYSQYSGYQPPNSQSTMLVILPTLGSTMTLREARSSCVYRTRYTPSGFPWIATPEPTTSRPSCGGRQRGTHTTAEASSGWSIVGWGRICQRPIRRKTLMEPPLLVCGQLGCNKQPRFCRIYRRFRRFIIKIIILVFGLMMLTRSHETRLSTYR